MDSLAKTYWNATSSTVAPFYPFNASGWSIWTGERKLTCWDHTALYNHAQSTDIISHWSQHRKIPLHMIQSIHWEACKDAIKHLGLHRSLWVPKWLGGFAPVGKVLQRYKLQPHAECPRCSDFEDTAHVLRCKAPLAVTQWHVSLAQLDEWLLKSATMPDLRCAILNCLKAWQDRDPTPAPNYHWPGVNELLAKQDLVGWHAFLEGCILKDWAAKQQSYYDWLQWKNTGKRWTTTLIKKLWEISWDMCWEQRNGELKNPASPAQLREHARLDALIAPKYTDIRTLAKKDRRWFQCPKEVLYTEIIDYKTQWLESVLLARARYTRRHRRDLTCERAAMRDYLRRSTSPASPS